MMRFVILLLLAGSFSLTAATSPQTFTGIISDSMCGSDHRAMNLTRSRSACWNALSQAAT
jgi:hypothetical protein